MASPNTIAKFAAAGLPMSVAAQVVFETGVYIRVDGWSGLPYANITSLAVQRYHPSSSYSTSLSDSSPRTILHIGTAAGVASAVITPRPSLQKHTIAGHLNIPRPVKEWEWSYKFLARYLPGPRVTAVAASTHRPSPFVLVATAAGPMPESRPAVHPRSNTQAGEQLLSSGGCGLAVLEWQQWSLADKAARVERIQNSRHSRYGMVSECEMAGFGDLSRCSMGDNDNNGLWTAVVVAAEALRYNVNPDADALAALENYLNGMILLNNVRSHMISDEFLFC